MHRSHALSLGRFAALVAVTAGLALPLRQTTAQAPPVKASPRLALQSALQDSTFFVPGCKHDEAFNPSDIVCSDTSAFRSFSGRDIKSASITFVLNDGTSITQQLGRGFDAIFFSNLALRKFAIPYYNQTDIKKASMLEAFVARVKTPATLRPAAKPPASPETKEP